MLRNLIIFISLALPLAVCGQINQKDAQGLRHGKWKVNFGDTKNPKFEGTFEHGKRIGEFKFYKKGYYQHPAAIMQFPKNTDSVEVTYYTQKGKPISTGQLVDKKREGTWVYFHQKTDSIMMTEVYQNDTLNGLQKTFFPNGKLAEKTNYENGEKDGESLLYSENAKLAKKLNYAKGKLDGKATAYNNKGEETMTGSYKNGKKTGTWKYFEDGKLKNEENY